MGLEKKPTMENWEIRKMINKIYHIKSFENISLIKKYLILSIFIGSLSFIYIYGIDILDVTNDIWLLNAEDLNQHYLGWKFFRNSTWGFPIGLIEGITEMPISIIYTDSIPILAVFFKLISFLLPDTFQYFGIWGLVCYILQAFFAMILLDVFVKRKITAVIGSVVFVFSTIVMMRMYAHSALAGNWIILAALTAWAKRNEVSSNIKRCLIWFLLMALSVSIHMYFMPMVFAIMCASVLNQYLDDSKKWGIQSIMLTLCFSCGGALFVMYCLGAFYGSPGVMQGGLREYSTNLNAFYNSFGHSRFLKGFSIVNGNQGEGYAYLGAGILIALLIGGVGNISLKRIYTNKNFYICLMILVLVLGGYSLSPRVTWNEIILLDIGLPDILLKLFSIFRVTGRFIWPVYYLLFLAGIVWIEGMYKKRFLLMLSVIVIIQIMDLTPVKDLANSRVKYNVPSILYEDAWCEIGKNFDKIEFITSYEEKGGGDSLIVTYFSMKEVFDLANFACDNGMNMNDFYIGRRNGKYIEKVKWDDWNDLKKGVVKSDTVYVFNRLPLILMDIPEIKLFRCDNLIIGIRSNYEWIHEPQISISNYKPIDIIQLGKNIIDGVDNSEGRVLYPNGISYGPYAITSAGKYLVRIKGENLENGTYDANSEKTMENVSYDDLHIGNTEVTYTVTLKDVVEDFEVRAYNGPEKNLIIKEFTIQKVDE